MKPIFSVFVFLFSYHFVQAQTVTVSGQCMSGSITLAKEGATVDGKVAYSGTGTVASTPNVAVAIYWIGAPYNVWALAFDGQPYFQSACNTSLPPGTANTSCAWSEVTPGSCTGGSPLSIGGTGVTLPVRFISFTGQAAATAVQLNWKTAVETSNNGFEVQRSNDGNTWTALGFVNGHGNSTVEQVYQFIDAAPRKGQNIYRLLQSDVDGRSTYSNILAVSFTGADVYTLQQIGNGIYNVIVDAASSVELTVVDLNGRKLFSRSVATGQHKVDISSYAKGIYLLHVKNGTQLFTEKLINH